VALLLYSKKKTFHPSILSYILTCIQFFHYFHLVITLINRTTVPAQKTEDRHKSSLTAVQSAKNQPGLSTSASYIAVLAMTAAQSLKRLTNFPEAVNPKHLDHSKKNSLEAVARTRRTDLARSRSPTSGVQRAIAGAAADVMLVAGLGLPTFRGTWTSRLCLGVEFQRAGDEFRGVEAVGLGLEDLDEMARNLSRKCCSQSAEGIVAVVSDLTWPV
jgi:hypothetical protein